MILSLIPSAEFFGMKSPTPQRRASLAMILGPVAKFLLARFQRLYYQAVESSGRDKREILVTRVETARDSLQEAKEQFQSALDRFSALTRFDGGDLEEVYRQLRVEYDYSRARALAVRDRIDAVEDMAAALFLEWEDELDQYASRSLRSSSRQKLRQTQQHYGQLITAMRRAENKIDPVLRAFNDQVLYLKHNLNAKAVASLQGELAAMSVGVAGLIGAMERSITRANDFVVSLNGQKALPAAS
jgi:predicted  nucleic acid-binding Zn-ribbon protein